MKKPQQNNAQNCYQFAAFTLAEVLITLTIIGVIAALTIPNLMQSYKKHQVEVGVKEAYSILSNTIKIAESDTGLNRTEMLNFINGQSTKAEDLTLFIKNYILPYVKYDKYCKNEQWCGPYFDNYNNYWKKSVTDLAKLQLKNGMFVMIVHDVTTNNLVFEVDINGPTKGPNKIGSDTFFFHLKKNNSDQIFTGNPYTWSSNQCNNSDKYNCSSVIQKNGWKIPDDYPVKKF